MVIVETADSAIFLDSDIKALRNPHYREIAKLFYFVFFHHLIYLLIQVLFVRHFEDEMLT